VGTTFEWSAHPIRRSPSTLAWSRVDIDFENGEALIEEIQTDWVRLAERAGTAALATLVEGGRALPYGLSVFDAMPYSSSAMSSTFLPNTARCGIRR
jgi:hypothetical protein